MTERQVRLAIIIACVAVALNIVFGHGIRSGNAQESPDAASVAPTDELIPRIWLPMVLNRFPPPATISRYMASTDYSTLFNLGCSRGQTIPTSDAVIILDFGQPAYSNGQYGTWIFGDYTFRSTGTIEMASRGFLAGFYSCSASPVSLTLAVGTSNYGAGVTREHGEAWAEMVNLLNAWVASPPSYADKIAAVWGAIDAEPSWNDPSPTRAWADGFDAVHTGSSRYANFGTCDGCPYSGCPTCVPNRGWSREDIWYVSWGALSAYPLPEIYLTNGINADQWYRMSLYAYTDHGHRMVFAGSLTQWNACQEGNVCTGDDNRPEAGYLQLCNAVNADSRTAQTIRWSTDMSWQK